jgi:predicted dehydrogenase
MSTTTPVRIGIIGTGMMGLEHIRNLQAIDEARIVAIADPHPESLEWARMTLGEGVEVPEFADHRALLDADLCDAVIIASPNMTHAEVLLDVLAAGVDCLVEKPLCTTMEDCRRVEAAARASDSLVWVGLEYRYMPPVARAISVARSGEVGTVRMVAMREHRFPFLVKVGDWNRFNENTGGTLVEKCCHFFDLLGLLAGAPAVRVMASGAQDVNHLDESYDGRVPDIIDNALVIIEYANGVRGSLDLCMFAEGSENQEELSVVGDLGKVEAFLPSAEVRVGLRRGWRDGVVSEVVVDERVAHEGFHHGSSYLEHLDFLAAVRDRTEPVVTVADGLASVAVGVAAQIALAEHRVVELAEVL